MDFLKNLLNRTDLLKVISALTVLLCFFLIVYALVFLQIPEQNREPLLHVLGIIDALLGLIVGYYFGSSKGSQQKTELIDKMTNK
jgi:uncharacterized membrane protein HdeD (DUF308 family)